MKKKSNNQIIDEVIKTTIRAIFVTIGSSHSTEKEKRNHTNKKDLEWFRDEFTARSIYDESKIEIVKTRLNYDEEKYDKLVAKRLRKCLGVSYPTIMLISKQNNMDRRLDKN